MSSDLNQTSLEKRKYFPVLDLVRFLAALLIVGVHIFPEGSTTEGIGLDRSAPTLLGLSFMNACLRIAVPVFFLISSFLLFKKIGDDQEHKWQHIGAFCLRVLFLYLFWYVAGLPLTIRDITGFVSQGNMNGLIRFIVITFWKGAPRGYWFLVALTLSVVITASCRSKKSMTVLAVIAGLMYVYGCLNSVYFGIFLLNGDPVSKTFYQVGEYLELSFCPLQALFFVVLGRLFAEHGPLKIKGNAVILPAVFLLMMGELFLTMYGNLYVYPDAFFSLPIFAFFLMNLLLGINVENEKFTEMAKKLKRVGSFSYLFHFQFFCYMHWILDAAGNNIFRDQYGWLFIPYLICVAICFGLQTLFEYLSKYKYLRFLRYSY